MLFISIYAIVLLDGYQQIRFQTHAFFRRNRFVGCGARCGAKLLDFGRPGRRYRVIADAPSAMFARSIPIAYRCCLMKQIYMGMVQNPFT